MHAPSSTVSFLNIYVANSLEETFDDDIYGTFYKNSIQKSVKILYKFYKKQPGMFYENSIQILWIATWHVRDIQLKAWGCRTGWRCWWTAKEVFNFKVFNGDDDDDDDGNDDGDGVMMTMMMMVMMIMLMMMMVKQTWSGKTTPPTTIGLSGFLS